MYRAATSRKQKNGICGYKEVIKTGGTTIDNRAS